jgi:hypothetical protein
MTPTHVPKESGHVTWPKRPKRRRCNVLTNSECQLVLKIPIDSNVISASNQSHWLDYEIIFPSICGSSKTEFGYVLGDCFIADWSRRPKQTRTRIGQGLRLSLNVLADLLRWWPRRRMYLGIS